MRTAMIISTAAPKFNLQDVGGGTLQSVCQYIAAGILLIWICYVLFQYATPSRRGRGAFATIGGAKIFGLVVLLAVLVDLSLIDTFIELLYNMATWLSQKFRELFGGMGVGGGTVA